MMKQKLDSNLRFNLPNNQVQGTPEYMAPELFKHKGYSLASEFWSFGCMIYEMLIGVPPFLDQEDSDESPRVKDFKQKKPLSE